MNVPLPSATEGVTDTETTAPEGAEDTTEQPETTEQPDGTETLPDESALGDAGKRALAAERKARKDAEKQLAELKREAERAKMTEQQRAADDLRQATEKAAAERLENLRLRAALKHGITDEYLDLIDGADGDAIEAKAAKVAALTKQGQERDAVPAIGSQPVHPGTASLPELIAAAEKDGNYALSGQLKAQLLSQSTKA